MALDIIGVGYACQDTLVRIQRLPVWEDRVPVLESGSQGGGVVGTAMYAAAKLGSRVGMVGRAGDDQTGRAIRDDFARAGVDVSRFELHPGGASPFSVVLVDAVTGSRSFLVYRGNAPHLTESDLDPTYLAQAKYVHVDGIQPSAALGAARLARRLGVAVSVDGSDVVGELPPTMRELVGLANVLVCARSFAEALTGLRDEEEMCRCLLTFGPKVGVVTLAERGSLLAAGGDLIRQPGFPVEVVDTTGAGDVYHGAFLHALAAGWSLDRVQEFACVVAALKCTRLGGRAAIPTPEEVEAARPGLTDQAR